MRAVYHDREIPAVREKGGYLGVLYSHELIIMHGDSLRL